MAGGIEWKSVELQIEALLPGIIFAAECLTLATVRMKYNLPAQSWLPASEFVRAAIFVAGSYALGVILSLLSRALVDSLSERGPRALLFNAFAHANLEKLLGECQRSDEKFAADLSRERSERHWKSVADWNAAYRSVLRRTTRRDEVDRRRSQGRFIRNLFFPALVAPMVAFGTVPAMFLGIIITLPLMVLLYAYAEYVNFAEAYDISEAKPK